MAERKRKINKADPPWLNDYLKKAYYPSKKDVENIREKIEVKREIYTRVIKKPRDKYIAHREKRSPEDVKILFSGGTVDDLWRLSNFLLRLSEVFWHLYNNGKRPNFSLRMILR